MLRTNPTRIDLKSEDLREYEEAKKNWPKIPTKERVGAVDEAKYQITDQQTRNSRIGLKGNK